MVLDLLPNRMVAAKLVIHVADMAAEQASQPFAATLAWLA